jgi:Tfp pilus assembly protein PilX
MFRTPRGSALLAALIIIGVVALVTVATLQIASVSKDMAARDSRVLSQTSCVEAARQYVLGRLRVFGVEPTSIVLDKSIAVDTGTRKLRTGHINDTATINAIAAVPPQLVGSAAAKTRDISNMIVPSATLGGRTYRVVVACTDPLAGDMELEFTFKYGL